MLACIDSTWYTNVLTLFARLVKEYSILIFVVALFFNTIILLLQVHKFDDDGHVRQYCYAIKLYARKFIPLCSVLSSTMTPLSIRQSTTSMWYSPLSLSSKPW